MPTNLRTFVTAGLLSAALSGWLVTGYTAQPEMLPVEQVRPGMKGVCRTVLTGERVEEIELEVVDVLHNYFPKQDVVLVRLLGPEAERVGVAAGMSGSPVYIEGKLLGAIAYRFGVFSKDPLAGVTPLQYMLPVVEREERRGALWRPSTRHFEQSLQACLLGEPADQPLFGTPQRSTSASSLQPWPKLLVLSGFREEVAQWAGQWFNSSGYVVAQGAGAESDVPDEVEADLEPGSPVGLVLLDGDASIQVVGTVTWRDGDRILAFGHPVFDAGPISFPMGRVRIAATIPSLMASQKMPLLVGLIGTFYQDRLTGSFGRIGPLPHLTPVRVRCQGADATTEQFFFRAALDPSLRTMVPFYLRIALINAIETSRMSGGDYSLRLRSHLYINGHEEVELENFYARRETPGFLSPMEDVLRSTLDVASAIASLMFNPFRPVQFDSVNVEVEILPKSRRAQVIRLWYDRARVRAGDTLTVICTLLTNEGEWRDIRWQYRLPNDLPERGNLYLTAGGATELARLDLRNFPHRFKPLSFEQLLRILREKRRNDRLYIQLRTSDAGLAVGSKELPSAPPSVLAVFNARQSSGDVRALRTRIVHEARIPLPFEVTGSKSVTLTIRNEKHGK